MASIRNIQLNAVTPKKIVTNVFIHAITYNTDNTVYSRQRRLKTFQVPLFYYAQPNTQLCHLHIVNKTKQCYTPAKASSMCSRPKPDEPEEKIARNLLNRLFTVRLCLHSRRRSTVGVTTSRISLGCGTILLPLRTGTIYDRAIIRCLRYLQNLRIRTNNWSFWKL